MQLTEEIVIAMTAMHRKSFIFGWGTFACINVSQIWCNNWSSASL